MHPVQKQGRPIPNQRVGQAERLQHPRQAKLVTLFSAIWSLLAAFRQTTPYKNEL